MLRNICELNRTWKPQSPRFRLLQITGHSRLLTENLKDYMLVMYHVRHTSPYEPDVTIETVAYSDLCISRKWINTFSFENSTALWYKNHDMNNYDNFASHWFWSPVYSNVRYLNDNRYLYYTLLKIGHKTEC